MKHKTLNMKRETLTSIIMFQVLSSMFYELLVPGVGFEPTRDYSQQFLKL